MKKILSMVLAACILLSVCVMTGCGSSKKLKFGMGVYTKYSQAISARGDTPGSVDSEHTVAAVTLSEDGKIVACKVDTVELTPSFTSDGNAITTEDVLSKYELGEEYGMKEYGAKLEWFEQADKFCETVVGKTIDEVKALVAKNGKGTDEIVNAGCTIAIAEFVLALEKAVNNAVDSNATEKDTLNVAIVAVQGESRDATEDANGITEVECSMSAAVVDKDGKVVVMSSDALTASASFSTKGVAKNDITVDLKTKKELGNEYGMKAYGAKLEWFEQAAAFDGLCVGKTADEIVEFEVNGYGTEDVQNAGCTIAISDMVKAAVSAATID